MPRIAVRDRRFAISKLVTDTLTPRIQELCRDVHDHWMDVVTEMFDAETIRRNNRVITDLYANRDVVSMTIEDESGWSSASNLLKTSNLRIRNISTVTAPSSTNPIGLNINIFLPGFVGTLIQSAWEKAAPASTYDLPEVLFVMTENDLPHDDPNSCSIVNPDTFQDNVWEFDINDFIPVDCRTQREFITRMDSIRDDLERLFQAMDEATANCRTDTALIGAIPELKPYVSPDMSVAVGDLLKQAAIG